jgi:hypothetical protein
MEQVFSIVITILFLRQTLTDCFIDKLEKVLGLWWGDGL